MILTVDWALTIKNDSINSTVITSVCLLLILEITKKKASDQIKPQLFYIFRPFHAQSQLRKSNAIRGKSCCPKQCLPVWGRAVVQGPHVCTALGKRNLPIGPEGIVALVTRMCSRLERDVLHNRVCMVLRRNCCPGHS